MKMIFLALSLILVFNYQASACSEAGPRDFEIPAKLESTCAKVALKYARNFADTIVQIEKQEKAYGGPSGGFKPTHPLPVLYTTKARVGDSKLIGFNVSLDSKNKWECNYCVDMSIDSDNNCRIESIRKHMCAK